MLKTLIQRTANAFGYRISRIRPELPPTELQAIPDPPQLSQLMAELERFAALNPGRGMWSVPHRAREYLSNKRLRFYQDLLDVCARHGVSFAARDIVDVGSGTGYLLRLVRCLAQDSRLTGYDTYADITELARALCPSARFIHKDLFDIENEQYDVIFNTEVLEHLMRPDLALRHLFGLVRESGSIVLTVPNGRTDTFEAGGQLDNGHGYWGHINFWSPESWKVFVNLNAHDGRATYGLLPTGENYAIVHKS